MLGLWAASGLNGGPFNPLRKTDVHSRHHPPHPGCHPAGRLCLRRRGPGQAPAKTQSKTPAAELSAKDKAAVETSFGRTDANGDGKLSKEEAVKLPAIAAKFDEFDKNKDGFLSLDEFAAGVVTPS